MLRGFFLISLLLTIAAVAVLGFRGQKGTNEPWEIFPDMVRQMKVRAQAPLQIYFAYKLIEYTPRRISAREDCGHRSERGNARYPTLLNSAIGCGLHRGPVLGRLRSLSE